ALANVLVVEQVVDGPRDAMALRLPRDNDGVTREQLLDQPHVDPVERVAVRALGDLWPEQRVVLGARVVPLHLEVRPAVPGHTVEEDRLLERGYERVPDPPEHRVVGPDRQVVLAASG